MVKNIGDIPFVPATIGAKLTNGIYGLACLPSIGNIIYSDILEEPTPIVPFSATTIMRLSDVRLKFLNFSLRFLRDHTFSVELIGPNENAPDFQESRSVEISPSAATKLQLLFLHQYLVIL
ncbi:MAG: hypothetical protein CM15mP58_14150 [Burkholderiaceae bacterium]|nr:MAG: hypothetical protein CM15mP58_14150 [Burkholderiaceae bacterium]